MCVAWFEARCTRTRSPSPPPQKKKRLPISYIVHSWLSTLYAHGKRLVVSYRDIAQGLTCTVYTAKIPGRRGKVIAKVARRRNKGRLEDQAERQMEAEFNVLRQASCVARIAYKGSSVIVSPFLFFVVFFFLR